MVNKKLLQKIIDTANIIHTTNIRGDNNYVITSRNFAEAVNTIIKRQERRNKIKKLREE